jgi:hypothetical protein
MESYSGGRVDFDSKSNTFYYKYGNITKDTIAVLLDYNEVKDSDTIRLKTSYAHVNLSGDETASQLKLLSLKNYVRDSNKTNGKDDPLKFFEKAVIKKIREYK